jgi:WD40 repeat protein
LSTTGQCFRTFDEHKNVVKSICFHPNDRKFISSSYDKTIKEWDIRSGECLKTFTADETFDVANSAIYSNDLTKVFTAHNDSKIRIWDAETGDFLKEFGNEEDQHSLMVYSIQMSPNGKLLVSASEDSNIKIWDLATEKCLDTLKGHTQPINKITLNATGSRVLSTSRDKTIREWDLETGVCRQVLEGHFDSVTDVLYHPDLPFIYSSSLDNTIKKWIVHGIEEVLLEEKIDNEVKKVKKDKKKLEDKKNFIKEKAKEEKGNSIFDSLSKFTGILTNTVKKVVINRKDDSVQTLYSASGLYLQGADFRNLQEKSKFSNHSKDLLRQYGAIFNKEDKENWEELIKKLKVYKMD